jgi:hypothetical protein
MTIRCLGGSWSFRVTGRGRRTSTRSVAVLMLPAARRWADWSMHLCGVKDSVQ